MMPALYRAATMTVADYDPSVVIDAVNALQPLGKEGAMEAIASCLTDQRHTAYPAGLLWVLRVLFDLPPSQRFPSVNIGTPDIPAPVDPDTLPRFPIVIVNDIPFLVVRGYVLRGLPEPVEAHIRYFGDHGVVRDRLLVPPASLDAIEGEFLRVWHAAYGDAHTGHVLKTIRQQIARLGRDTR
jgi:hypothetical protein